MKQHEVDRHRGMSEQLGMPRGTAANRLRKLVLFDVLKRHNENACYRCSEIIESAEQLSIEHKQPWEHVDARLFWDLDNIAFSHLSCNSAAGRKGLSGTIQRKIGPKGTAWCSTHQQFLPIENFSLHSKNWRGLCYECKNCQKEYKDFVRHGE